MNMFDGTGPHFFDRPHSPAPDNHISDVRNMVDHVAPVGFCQLYYVGESNHCPGCGGTHWFVGRTVA